MENAVKIKNCILAAGSGFLSFVMSAFGGWDLSLKTLVVFMAGDYIAGLLVAGVFHNSGKSKSGALESRAGFKGLVRKCVILGLVLLSAALDAAVGVHYIRTAVCIFFTANEGLSILENLGLMGVPYPSFLKNMLEVLQKRSSEGQSTLSGSDAKEDESGEEGSGVE